MSTEKGLLHAIREAPGEDEPRLIYADWLEDNGQQPRGQLIRLQCRMASIPEQSPEARWLQRETEELLDNYDAQWKGDPSGPLTFERGFLSLRNSPDALDKKWWKQFGPHVMHASLYHVKDLRNFISHTEASQIPDIEVEPVLAPTNTARLKKLSELRRLSCHLEDDKWEANVAGLSRLNQLTSLKINLTARSGDFRCLAELPCLHELTLDVSTVKKTALKPLRELPSLQKVHIYNGDDPGTVVKYFSQVPTLRSFSVTYIIISQKTVQSMSSLTQIEELELCPTDKVRSGWLEHLAPLQNLKRLIISESDFVQAGDFRNLEQLPHLELLDLNQTEINEQGMKALSGLKQLKSLFLSGGNFGGRAIKHLTSLENLETLDLSWSQVTDTAAKHLEAIPTLKWLDLRETRMKSSAIKQLQKKLPDTKIDF